MPDVTIEIGGRSFTVACQPGEEAFLTAAAQMLDREAQTLVQSGARLTQDRMLLMAGLMLADKAISAEEELRTMDQRVAEAESRPAPDPVEIVREVEVPVEKVVEKIVEKPVDRIVEKEVVREVLPEGVAAAFEDLATRAESLAAQAAERGAPAA